MKTFYLNYFLEFFQGESQQFQGIYIKAIVPGGAAEDDGRLQAGDQILCVDKISLIDITQEQ
jgi:C-terminal processing protease CtpA/Prc